MADTNFSSVDVSDGYKVNGTTVIDGNGAIIGDIQATAGSISSTEVADSDGSTGGSYVAKRAMVVYDFATDGGAIGSLTPVQTFTIPDNAIIYGFLTDVITTFTSATDAATVKVSLPTDGDLTTAIAISNAANHWDAGVKLSNSPLAVKTTGERAIQITIATEALTAGKAIFYIDYMISGA